MKIRESIVLNVFQKVAFVQRRWCGQHIVFLGCLMLPDQTAELNKRQFLIARSCLPEY